MTKRIWFEFACMIPYCINISYTLLKCQQGHSQAVNIIKIQIIFMQLTFVEIGGTSFSRDIFKVYEAGEHFSLMVVRLQVKDFSCQNSLFLKLQCLK